MQDPHPMVLSRPGMGGLALFLLIGVLAGNAVGQFLALMLPDHHVVETVFIRTLSVGIDPISVDLAVFSFVLGFRINVNFISFLGMAVAGYYWKYAY